MEEKIREVRAIVQEPVGLVLVDREKLREIEWNAFNKDKHVLGDGVDACPVCRSDWNSENKHIANCWLGGVLRRGICMDEKAGSGMNIQNSEEKCDICGKVMTNPRTGSHVIGAELALYNGPEEDKAFVQEQAGAYKVDCKYQICWECMLRSYGIPVVPLAK